MSKYYPTIAKWSVNILTNNIDNKCFIHLSDEQNLVVNKEYNKWKGNTEKLEIKISSFVITLFNTEFVCNFKFIFTKSEEYVINYTDSQMTTELNRYNEIQSKSILNPHVPLNKQIEKLFSIQSDNNNDKYIKIEQQEPAILPDDNLNLEISNIQSYMHANYIII